MPHFRSFTLSLTALFLFLICAFAQSEKAMTNQELIRLVRMGLSADIIVTETNDSKTFLHYVAFATSNRP